MKCEEFNKLIKENAAFVNLSILKQNILSLKTAKSEVCCFSKIFDPTIYTICYQNPSMWILDAQFQQRSLHVVLTFYTIQNSSF